MKVGIMGGTLVNLHTKISDWTKSGSFQMEIHRIKKPKILSRL